MPPAAEKRRHGRSGPEFAGEAREGRAERRGLPALLPEQPSEPGAERAVAQGEVPRAGGQRGEIGGAVEAVDGPREEARRRAPREGADEVGGRLPHGPEEARDHRLEDVGAPVGERRREERGDLLVPGGRVAAGKLDGVGRQPRGPIEPRVERVEERAQNGRARRGEGAKCAFHAPGFYPARRPRARAA